MTYGRFGWLHWSSYEDDERSPGWGAEVWGGTGLYDRRSVGLSLHLGVRTVDIYIERPPEPPPVRAWKYPPDIYHQAGFVEALKSVRDNYAACDESSAPPPPEAAP